MARIFIAGASGYIGLALTEIAIRNDYRVHGLSRTAESDAKLEALGAVPVRGDLASLDVLKEESSQADIVLYLAFVRSFDNYEEILRVDKAAVDAIAKSLQGTNKPFVISAGTASVESDPNGGETTEESPLAKKPFVDRYKAEGNALSWAAKGVRRHIYPDESVRSNGEVVIIEDGSNRASGVHVDDAARLYILMAQKAKAGDVFNATNSAYVTSREMAEAIGKTLGVPTKSLSPEKAEEKWPSWLVGFIRIDNRASGQNAVQQLDWNPREVDILTDIRSGSYRALGDQLLAAKGSVRTDSDPLSRGDH